MSEITGQAMMLTEEQIQEIVAALHEEIQFFDNCGQADNATAREQIAAALRKYFGEAQKEDNE